MDLMNPDSNVADRPDTIAENSAPATTTASDAESGTLVDTTLIEEISIDGMCGVY